MKKIVIVLCLLLTLCGCFGEHKQSQPVIEQDKQNENSNYKGKRVVLHYVEYTLSEKEVQQDTSDIQQQFDLSEIPSFNGQPYYIYHDNQPFFTQEEKKQAPYEYFSQLDELGRCQVVHAMLDQSLMPQQERESIGMIKPSGWKLSKYDFVDGKYLFNRCHLIGYQLSGENANVLNLITGTRYLNVEGMLPFENMVADYIEKTNHRVLYRVTPIYEKDNLVASGVLMEAYSIEDQGTGICFCVYCYNVQPGVIINYANGENQSAESHDFEINSQQESNDAYVLNTSSKKIHLPQCKSAELIAPKNYDTSNESIESLYTLGYTCCGNCLKMEEKEHSVEQNSTYYVLNTRSKKIHLPKCHSVDLMSEKNYAESHESIATLESKGYTCCGNCLQ